MSVRLFFRLYKQLFHIFLFLSFCKWLCIFLYVPAPVCERRCVCVVHTCVRERGQEERARAMTHWFLSCSGNLIHVSTNPRLTHLAGAASSRARVHREWGEISRGEGWGASLQVKISGEVPHWNYFLSHSCIEFSRRPPQSSSRAIQEISSPHGPPII